MSQTQQIIITGLPRSGTSYLCILLHLLKNSIAINEPREMFKRLNQQAIPWAVKDLYTQLEQDILTGKPIENKLHQDQLVEDTVNAGKHALYQPHIENKKILLATKNTLGYLARLEQLHQVLPQALIIACIRHPADTIASWKTSFAHLKNATVEDFVVGSLHDPFISTWQHEHLQTIADEPNQAKRRALLWSYLAEILYKNRHILLLLKYEHTVCQPQDTLETIWQTLGNKLPLSFQNNSPTASHIRQKRSVLNEEDWQAINLYCKKTAAYFAYDKLD
ncbi:sulfotransferase [Candidatus Halobeggiatoa sp. HSG11]|nr:sulfotransferase [Candidatus Halobeggiatoa sp. HSG11]